MKTIEAQKFIEEYKGFYFDVSYINIYGRGIEDLRIPSNLHTTNEKAEEWIYDKCLSVGKFDAHALAWKAGKITWENNDICFASNFKKGNNYLNGLNYRINCQEFEEYCKNITIESNDIEEIYKSLWPSSPKNFGPVYIITSMYFATRGKHPIYDQFVHKALRSLAYDLPPSQIFMGSNPNKNEVASVMRMYNEYMYLLKSLFPSELNNPKNSEQYISRDLDQALWVYGHATENWPQLY